jgi:hypothetical protein
MDTTLIKDFSAPSELSLRPIPSSKPILVDAYELRPRLIEMVQTNTFLGIEDEDPYHDLQQFEQTCDCLHIDGMLDETLLEAFSIHSERKSSLMVRLNQREDETRLGNSSCRLLHGFLSLIQSSQP